jgi:hypothetical protein
MVTGKILGRIFSELTPVEVRGYSVSRETRDEYCPSNRMERRVHYYLFTHGVEAKDYFCTVVAASPNSRMRTMGFSAATTNPHGGCWETEVRTNCDTTRSGSFLAITAL